MTAEHIVRFTNQTHSIELTLPAKACPFAALDVFAAIHDAGNTVTREDVERFKRAKAMQKEGE